MWSFKNVDWQLCLAVGVLLTASMASLASTSLPHFYRQIAWLGFGIILAYGVMRFDWRPFVNYRGIIMVLFLAVVLLLTLTLAVAPSVRGAKAWIVVGGFQFQPSEFTKLMLIILYARFFSRKHVGIARASNIVASFVYFLIPAFLIALEPDMGSVMTLFAIWFGFVLVSGMRIKHLLAAVLIFLLVAAALWQAFLKPYQRDRVLGFLFVERDPLGVNYNVIQSKIAIGSAGFFGKGFGQGTQAQLGFLPEAKTDFLFAAFIEEWGLVGGVVLVAVFAYLLFRVIAIGLAAENNFNRFVSLGAVIFWGTQFALNVGSNVGLTPVVGVTFPFLSYGGSSLLTNMLLVGILQSIWLRRPLSL